MWSADTLRRHHDDFCETIMAQLTLNHGVIFYCAIKTASIVSVIVSGFKDVGCFGSVGVSS
jgi:hypothetical protein